MNTKNFSMRVICALLIGLCLNNLHATGANPVDYTLNFTYSGINVPTQVRAWVPNSSERLKGMILSIPGSGTDTRGITGNSTWQFQLPQMGFGIVGFRDLQDAGILTGQTSEETHANLQKLLDAVANSFSHPEIKNAPIILDGISKGGYGVSYMAPYLADRTLCYIADKGYQSPFVDSNDLQVPGLAIGGAHDEAVPPVQVQTSFTSSRSSDAKLAQLVDWNHGHLATSTVTKLAFIEQALRVRYPQNQLPSLTPNTPFPLVDVSHLAGAWLGEANQLDDTFTSFVPINAPIITQESLYPLDPASASWLPTQAMAMVYQAHNDRTFTTKPVQMSVVSPFNGKIVMDLSVSQITSNSLKLYHNEELIATLDPSNGPIRYTYNAKQNGLHTFIAVADYLKNGVMTQTSNYTTTVVAGVVTVPEPATAMLLIGGIGAGCLRRKRNRIAHKEF